MKVKKIAIVWESETGGGVNSHLRYLLQSKSFLDKEIVIFTNYQNSGAKSLINDFKEKKKIKFVFYDSPFVRKRNFLGKSFAYFFKPIFFIITIIKFKKIFSKSNFDVLLCECGNYGRFRSEPAAVLAAKRTNIPIKSIVIHHECVKAPLFMGFVLEIINYFFSKKLSSLITVSNATKETILKNSNLLKYNRVKAAVIHNGVPINKFIRKNYLDLKINKDYESILKIGMVSRLSPDKGHEDLILAFSKLSSEYKKKLVIIIVGEDERNQKSRLEKKIKNLNLQNKIIFLKIILSLDLLLSMTRSYEGFGLSIAEAMSVGTPVLATDVGGVKEFFDNDCGKLIKPGQIEDIKNSLQDFCDNKKQWDDKAIIARERIEKNFSAEIMGEKYMHHINLIANKTK